MREFSKKLINTIKELEGFRSKPYQDQRGVWTIGYGHTAAAGYPDPKQVTEITEEEAEQILIKDLTEVAEHVNKLILVNLPKNRLESIYSFVYNIGVAAFKKSTLLKYINNREYDKIETQLRRWCYADKKISKGLQHRRETEIKLWKGVKNALPSKKTTAVSISILTAFSAEILEILKTNGLAQVLFIAGFVTMTTAGMLFIVYKKLFKSKN